MTYAVGSLVRARDREWVVLPESQGDLLVLRPLGGTDDETTGIYLPLETVESAQFELPRPARVDSVILMEDITRGERVREYVVEGLVAADRWQTLCDGTSVGHKRIQEFAPVEIAAARFLALKHAAPPRLRRLAVYAVPAH